MTQIYTTPYVGYLSKNYHIKFFKKFIRALLNIYQGLTNLSGGWKTEIRKWVGTKGTTEAQETGSTAMVS